MGKNDEPFSSLRVYEDLRNVGKVTDFLRFDKPLRFFAFLKTTNELLLSEKTKSDLRVSLVV